MHKVLIISGTPIISGAEYVLEDFLKKTKYKKQIQILHSDIREVNEFYRKFEVDKTYSSRYLKPVGIVNNKFYIIKKIYNIWASFFIFYTILKNKEIKVVLGNNTGDIIYSYYSYILKKKHINYIHDMVEKNSFIAKTMLLFDRYVYKYIAVSNAVKKALVEIGINENKISVIYNGLNYNRSYNIKIIENKITFGFVGNIENRKNPLEFIDFIVKAKKLLPLEVEGQMVFGNVLDNSLFNRVHFIIDKNNLNIKLLGKLDRNNMKYFYENIHFLVLTSRRDPLPTVILEAFNNGVPVIAHNVDGVPEMVIDGYNGFLYNSYEDFEEILKKLLKFNYNKLQRNANLTIRDKFNLNLKIRSIENLLFEEK